MSTKANMKDKMNDIRKKNISPSQALINLNSKEDEDENEPEQLQEDIENKIEEEQKKEIKKDVEKEQKVEIPKPTPPEPKEEPSPVKSEPVITENLHMEQENESGKFSNLKNKLHKKRVEDTHVRRTFLIKKDLIDRLEELSGEARGFKQEFINTAIEMALNEIEREMKR